MKTIDLYVNSNGSITQTLQSIPMDDTTPAILHIAPGVYHEKLTINRPYITLCGESADSTVITYGDYANDRMPDGSKRGTFRSYTVLIDTHDVCFQNLTIQNSAAPRSLVGQAIALYADGDRLSFDNCRFISFQDTLFTGPLPEKEYQPGGFTGPKEFSPRINGRHYYHRCYICGDIDFIFGSATAFFDDCELHSICCEELPSEKDDSSPVYGYITAASTPLGQPYGYVFHNCRLTSDCPPQSVYLGRPWRDYAQTIFLNCHMDSHIKVEGFHDWDKPHAHDTVFYAEYECTSSENNTPCRAPFVHSLMPEQAGNYTVEKVLGGDDNWIPIP